MAEVQFSADQLNKLKNAMSRVSQFDTSLEAAPDSRPAVKPPTVGGELYAEPGDNLGRGTYLRIDKDAMSAWLYLMPPEEGQYYTKGDLETFLLRRGVIKGLHSSNLSAMIKKKVYNREILVAKGQQTIDGKDGYFEYFFSLDAYVAPKVLEDGSVDYTNMSGLPNVHEGDKVAVYHYAEPGTDGITVYGGVIKAKPAKDLPPIRGKGISREDNVYYALSDGKIEAKNGKIEIQKVHEIFGDVTLIIGKVEFFGDVVVNGNVESGVTIHAGRNIEVRGTTGCATLSAGGDVILSRGIQGGGKILTKGSVYADFIENTMVEAGGIVQSNTILNAQIFARDKVVTTGKKGCIIGGYVHGLKGIEAMTVGSDVEVRTILHCGYVSEAYERLNEVRRQEVETKEALADLVEAMTDALREKRLHGSSTSFATEAKLTEWNKQKDAFFEQLDSISNEREELEEIIEDSRGACIRIAGTVYRNVIIGINAEQVVIDKETRFMRYSADKGIIEAVVM